MTLMEDHSPDRIELRQREQIHVGDDLVHEEMKVLGTLYTSVDIVPGVDGEEVINIRFQTVQDLSCVSC